jgi:hypothetical protein
MRWILGGLVGLILLALIYIVGWFAAGCGELSMAGKTIVLQWGDGTEDGIGFESRYGAHAWVEPEGDAFIVKAKIHIGQPSWYLGETFDVGVIGRARTFDEANKKWGKVTWTEDALYFGDPKAGGYRVERKKFQWGR